MTPDLDKRSSGSTRAPSYQPRRPDGNLATPIRRRQPARRRAAVKNANHPIEHPAASEMEEDTPETPLTSSSGSWQSMPRPLPACLVPGGRTHYLTTSGDGMREPFTSGLTPSEKAALYPNVPAGIPRRFSVGALNFVKRSPEISCPSPAPPETSPGFFDLDQEVPIGTPRYERGTLGVVNPSLRRTPPNSRTSQSGIRRKPVPTRPQWTPTRRPLRTSDGGLVIHPHPQDDVFGPDPFPPRKSPLKRTFDFPGRPVENSHRAPTMSTGAPRDPRRVMISAMPDGIVPRRRPS